jgi:acetylornithine deacetylase/succinyl-diaminopimelate desuccinylase-like protein
MFSVPRFEQSTAVWVQSTERKVAAIFASPQRCLSGCRLWPGPFISLTGRIWLGSFLLVTCLPAVQATDSAAYREQGREIYRELIETYTSHSVGDTTKAAELLAMRFRAVGFPESDIQIIGPEPTNKNLIVRYRGSNSKPPALLLAHLDVVEAKREDWTFDPFKLTEKDGYFYGRGTSDDKDGVTTLSSALLRLRSEGFKPNRDLILAVTAGEEGGQVYNGVEWLLAQHRELIKAAICLNADAGGVQKRKGKRLLYAVQAAEKVYQSYRLEIKGPGGHSSKPTKDNTVYRLAAALVRLSGYEFPVNLNEITRGYLEKMSKIESEQTAADMRGVLNSPPDPEAIKRLSASPFYNAMLRTTAVATMLEAGHAENALPQTARAVVNCRILPGESPVDVQNTLRKILADDQITITPVKPAKPSPPSPLSAEIVTAIQQAKDKLWPGIPIVPIMEAGATDGLSFRQIGIPTYGITGTAVDLDDVRMHGKDERMGVEDFYNGLEFEYQLIKAVASD